MSDSELFFSQSNFFSGFQKTFQEADYVIFGVPFDITSTYRSGARFAPNAVRQASLNIETYSFRTGLDVEDLRLHDLGDLHISMETSETLKKIARVVAEVLGAGKIPVVIGGEHTITFGVAAGLGEETRKTALLSFDAHLDLRSEFMGVKLSHTTFMRRINEELKPAKIFEVGTRAVCREELAYAQNSKIELFTAHHIRREGSREVAEKLKEKLAKYEKIYVSIDMDVLDPAYAPAVQNPEVEGIETQTLLDILEAVCDSRTVGFDVVEVSPSYDQGLSAIQAAKIIFEILCFLENAQSLR